jgi:hypothetical protein
MAAATRPSWRRAIQSHPGGPARQMRAARGDVRPRSVRWSRGWVSHCQISPIESGPLPIVTAQGRIRGRMPIVLPLSPIGRSHPGNPGVFHRLSSAGCGCYLILFPGPKVRLHQDRDGGWNARAVRSVAQEWARHRSGNGDRCHLGCRGSGRADRRGPCWYSGGIGGRGCECYKCLGAAGTDRFPCPCLRAHGRPVRP